ncbi:hypothetical protein MG293_000147 [Ovis ammon polii]|uniref:Uncharacterized protein n=1 Tax=Ovis ammon polii TaxID=230172 RepID=A0AAD4UJU1_OVIAM|nr:hypothetical protein MG293_000147 [Ovis ammon polii]
MAEEIWTSSRMESFFPKKVKETGFPPIVSRCSSESGSAKRKVRAVPQIKAPQPQRILMNTTSSPASGERACWSGEDPGGPARTVPTSGAATWSCSDIHWVMDTPGLPPPQTHLASPPEAELQDPLLQPPTRTCC